MTIEESLENFTLESSNPGFLSAANFEKAIKTLHESLRKMCLYSELFWSAFSRIRTEYGEILRISAYSVRMRENADQKNSEYGHFSRSECVLFLKKKINKRLKRFNGNILSELEMQGKVIQDSVD